MNEAQKEQKKLVLKKTNKQTNKKRGPISPCKEHGEKPLQSLGYRGNITQSDPGAMFRTDHKREVHAESERPEVEYHIYLGNR